MQRKKERKKDKRILDYVIVTNVSMSINGIIHQSNVKPDRIDIGITATIQGSIITVKDNGPGIPPDIINEIFTPFFTTKESGTGIGLSLSKQIIRNHGGTISVHSIPGLETTFTIELPG